MIYVVQLTLKSILMYINKTKIEAYETREHTELQGNRKYQHD